MKNLFSRIKGIRISRKTVLWVSCSFLAFLLLLVLATPPLVKYYFLRKVHQIEQRKHIRIDVAGFEFRKLSNIYMDSVRVIPLKNDTFFTCNHLEVDLNFWKLLVLDPDVNFISANSVKCNFIKLGD